MSSQGVEARIIQKLAEWEREGEELPGFVSLYGELVAIQLRAKDTFAASPLNPVACGIAEALVQGQSVQDSPLLSFSDLSLDWEHVGAVFQEVALVVARDASDSSREVESLGKIASDTTHLKHVVELWYQGASLAPVVEASGIDREVLDFVAHAALKPFLALHSEALLPKVKQEYWRRRICPVCGGKPDFAFLDKERGSRWLLCSRCDAEWLFQRLECPYCGTQDQEVLSYFTDDKSLYRLYVCRQCHTYIKAIDLRQAAGDVLLPLERVLTLDLDGQGQEEGYRAGWIAGT